MKNSVIVLCADTASIRSPQLIGLEGEDLASQDWLRVFCSAMEARSHLQDGIKAQEVWVASSDEVDSINLAAALKKDSKDTEVYLLAFQGTGSLKSRASAAGINGTLSQKDFVERYSIVKKHRIHAVADVQGSSSDILEIEPSKQLSPKSKPPATSIRFGARGEAPSAQTAGKSAHVLSVVSASGGSGKSTVATLAALLSQSIGLKTLLLDADLQFGDMRYFLGIKDCLTIEELIRDQAQLEKLQPGGKIPALLAAPEHLEQSEIIVQELPGLLEKLKPLFDVIVVNTGAYWAEQHAMLLERSATSLFLIDQRPASLRACKHALDLCSRCGIATHPFLFAVNRCSRNAPLSSIDVSCALKGSHVVELQDGGREVGELLGAGLPMELIESKNSLCLSIEQTLIDILPQAAIPEKASYRPSEKGILSRFSLRKRKVACL